MAIRWTTSDALGITSLKRVSGGNDSHARRSSPPDCHPFSKESERTAPLSHRGALRTVWSIGKRSLLRQGRIQDAIDRLRKAIDATGWHPSLASASYDVAD